MFRRLTSRALFPLRVRRLFPARNREATAGDCRPPSTRARPARYGPVRVRVAFDGFWPGFGLGSFSAAHPYLKLKYFLSECRRDPDVCFVGPFTRTGRVLRDAARIAPSRSGCATVFYTGERVSAPAGRFDWSISYDRDNGASNLYLPGWVRQLNRLGLTPHALVRNAPEFPGPFARPGACAYVARHRTVLREAFFDRLAQRMEVASPGRSRNNCSPIGRSSPDKLAFLRHFRFNIAFENEAFPGYLTEKIVDAFAAGCVPVYWGDPLVAQTFSPDAFIHVRDESQFGAAVERILAADRDGELYGSLRNAAPLLDNRLPDYATHDYAMAFFERIFDEAVRR